MPEPIADQIESAYAELGRRNAFQVNPNELHPSLPDRRVGIDELRSILMHPSVDYDTQDAVLVELVRRAQDYREDWISVTLAMLLPGIRRLLARFTRRTFGESDHDDIEAEIVTAIIVAIGSFKLDNARGAAGRILWAGFRAGLAYRNNQNADYELLDNDVADIPDGHPDFVLAEAVEAGVITTEQAWLIAETRLGGAHLPTIAASQGVGQDTMRHRRAKAERQLRAWISGVGE